MARSGSDRSGSDKAANRIKNYGGETMDGCDSTSRAIRGGRHMDIRTQFGYSLILFMTIYLRLVFCCLNHRMKDGGIFMPRNKEVEDNEEMDEKKELHSAVKEAFAG